MLALSTIGLIAAKWNETTRRRIDFHIYYQAVRNSRPESLYDYTHPTQHLGFTYPPFSALVIWPLTQLSEHTAELMWLTVSCLLGAVFWVICSKRIASHRMTKLPSWAVPLVAAAGMWTLPVVLTVRIGQINALVAIMLGLEIILLERRSKFSGVGIGVATAMKLTPGLLIPFLWFCGRKREAVQAAAFTVLFTAIGAIPYPSDSKRYFRTELWDTNRAGSLDRKLNNGIRRYVAWLPVGNGIQSLIWVALAAVVLVIGFKRSREAFRNGDVLRRLAHHVRDLRRVTHHLVTSHVVRGRARSHLALRGPHPLRSDRGGGGRRGHLRSVRGRGGLGDVHLADDHHARVHRPDPRGSWNAGAVRDHLRMVG